MANRFVSPEQQFSNSAGQPYAGGQLFFYVSETNTPADTYQDEGLTIPNFNPVTLDGAGNAGNIFLAPQTIYKVVLCSAPDPSTPLTPGPQIWTFDPVIPTDNVATAGVNTIVACSASGTNTITLTPLISGQQPTAYADYTIFAFVPSVTSTGSVVAQVGTLSDYPVFVAPGVQAGAGSLVAGEGPYFAAYGDEVAGATPGFLLINVGVTFKQTVILTSGSSYTPSGVLAFIKRTAIGGGGGGGGSTSTTSTQYSAGSGGGAGGLASDIVFNPAGPISFSIGAAGTGGTGGAGTAGGNTTFGALTANGGSPGVSSGTVGATSITAVVGGAGGTATGGATNLTGSAGGAALVFALGAGSDVALGGIGASGYLGMGAPKQVAIGNSTSTTNGNAGAAYGAGGGGSAAGASAGGATGGSGFTGVCIVEEWVYAL